MKCPNCNKRILLHKKYCPNCGKEIKHSPKKHNINIKVNKKLILQILVVLVILLLLISIILKEKYNEKNIAIKYFDSLITQNSPKGFKYIDAKETKYINENTYKKVLSKDKKLTKVINYTIQDINYSKDKDEAIITFSYITKKNKKHQTKDIVLVNKGKKWLFFTDWKVKTKDIISNNYKLYVNKDYNIKIDGIKPSKKELISTNKDYNVYRINKIFIGNYTVQVDYNDMDLRSKIFVQKNNSYSYINNLYLPGKQTNVLTKELVDKLELMYKNAIKSNSYKDIKKKINSIKGGNIKPIYNKLVDSTSSYYAQLKDFNVKDYHLVSTKVDDNVHLTISVNYKYKVKYYGETKTKTRTDDIEFIVKKVKDEYKLYDIKKLTYYFN